MSAPYNARQLAGLKVWEARRTWSRTDTTRWLDDHMDAAVGWLQKRRHLVQPQRVSHPGMWIKLRLPKNFDLIHDRLAAMSGPQRDSVAPSEVLP